MKTRDLTEIAVIAAVLCVAGPLTIAVGPVPLSLATFAVYLAGLILGPKKALAAVAVYLLIGGAGVPVFSGFSGGFQKLAGVTGGYLVGYLPCAFLSGLGVSRKSPDENRKGIRTRSAWLPSVLWMTVGTAVLYVLGTAWFMIQTHNTLGGALALCMLPFLPGDAVKIAAAAFLAPRIRSRL